MSFPEALLVSFEAIGRLFLVALVGFIFMKRKILTRDSLGIITRITIDVIVPCALSVSMLKGFNLEVLTRVSPLILVPVLIVALSSITALGVYRLLPGGDRHQDAAASAMAAIPNSFYVPFPLALAIAPPEHHVEVAMLVGVCVLAINPLQWTLGTFLVTAGAHGDAKRHWKESLRHVFNGPVIGIIGGALLTIFPPIVAAAKGDPGSFMPLRMVLGAMDMTGKAMAPLAMIILGALIAECEIKRALSFRLLAPIFLLRFLIVPGLVYWLITIHQIPAAGLLAFVLILESASPPATNLALVAKRFGGEWETASSVLLVTNLSALIILPLWMALGLRL